MKSNTFLAVTAGLLSTVAVLSPTDALAARRAAPAPRPVARAAPRQAPRQVVHQHTAAPRPAPQRHVAAVTPHPHRELQHTVTPHPAPVRQVTRVERKVTPHHTTPQPAPQTNVATAHPNNGPGIHRRNPGPQHPGTNPQPHTNPDGTTTTSSALSSGPVTPGSAGLGGLRNTFGQTPTTAAGAAAIAGAYAATHQPLPSWAGGPVTTAGHNTGSVQPLGPWAGQNTPGGKPKESNLDSAAQLGGTLRPGESQSGSQSRPVAGGTQVTKTTTTKNPNGSVTVSTTSRVIGPDGQTIGHPTTSVPQTFSPAQIGALNQEFGSKSSIPAKLAAATPLQDAKFGNNLKPGASETFTDKKPNGKGGFTQTETIIGKDQFGNVTVKKVSEQIGKDGKTIGTPKVTKNEFTPNQLKPTTVAGGDLPGKPGTKPGQPGAKPGQPGPESGTPGAPGSGDPGRQGGQGGPIDQGGPEDGPLAGLLPQGGEGDDGDPGVGVGVATGGGDRGYRPPVVAAGPGSDDDDAPRVIRRPRVIAEAPVVVAPVPEAPVVVTPPRGRVVVAPPRGVVASTCQGLWRGQVIIATGQPGNFTIPGLGGTAIVGDDGSVVLDCSTFNPASMTTAENSENTCLGQWSGQVRIPTDAVGPITVRGLGTATVTADRALVLDCSSTDQKRIGSNQ